MIKDTYKYFASGVVQIYKMTNGVKQVLRTTTNTVIPNAQNLLALILSGDDSAKIRTIKAYQGATLRATGVISQMEILTDGAVAFVTEVMDGAFTVDNMKLGPTDTDTLGFFAEADIEELEKPGDESLWMAWIIYFALP